MDAQLLEPTAHQSMDAFQTDTTPPENGTSVAAASMPRLEPIEELDSWWVWLAYEIAAWTGGR